MAENAGGVAAPVDNSPSLTSLVGEMFGDYRDAEPESDAGAPPDATPESPADSEGTAPSEPTGAPPVEADPSAIPDSNTPDPVTDLDPLDGATPLPYTVNGETRTFEGITVLKGGGGIIDPDALEKVTRVFGERDHLYEQSHTQHAKYEALERATKWPTADAQGKITGEITGVDALVAQRAFLARTHAELTTLKAALADPQRFAELVDIRQEGDQFVIAPNATAMKYLNLDAKNAAAESERTARAHFAQISAPPLPAPAPITDRALPTVEALTTQLRVTLSAEDKQFLAGQMPRYVRTTTPEEQQQGFGAQIVDASFTALVERTAKHVQETAKVATVATDAANANARRIAAASLGKGGSKQAAKITRQQEPEPSRADDFDTLWDKQERAAAGALKAHAVGR